MRLAFQDAYRLPHASQARCRLLAWCRWVRQGHRQFGALFEAMVKFAASGERPLEGILAHWKHGLTNAFLEGLNTVFSAVKRRARLPHLRVFADQALSGRRQTPTPSHLVTHRKRQRTKKSDAHLS